jgi:hypothetical protein
MDRFPLTPQDLTAVNIGAVVGDRSWTQSGVPRSERGGAGSNRVTPARFSNVSSATGTEPHSTHPSFLGRIRSRGCRDLLVYRWLAGYIL